MIADQSGALVIANQNFFPGRDGMTPRYIILHGTAGGTSAAAIANYFASTQGGDNPVSSHYVIGTDGAIVQCVSESDGAYANGYLSPGHDAWWNESINPNLITISIEHCKPSLDNSDALTPAQQAASFGLVKAICSRWNIPMCQAAANGGITGHDSLDPVNRSECPGVYPWSNLWQFLQPSTGGEQEMTILSLNDAIVKQYFTDGGEGRWHCTKYDVSLFGGILDYYKSNGGPALFGLPRTDELYLGEYPGTAIVVCERAILAYDPARKIDRPPVVPGQAVYLLHIDSGVGQQLAAKF